MPGSPESYVQEAGRAGRDGKPARCVLLFQPDDIAIQEHFLKEAHPTKTQARMVAEGLYAWSDEGKEVSVRDLAMSMALPERRVRVVLSVLEAMGVAKEIKASKWAGVEPRPTREQVDKAASVFEARRISDRRRLAELLKYMNTQRCRVQMMRAYFGEPEGEKCGLCDSDAGLDSELFDPGDADERHGLHAATDFHGRTRRRRRRKDGKDGIAAPPPPPPRPAAMVFETSIPEVLPALAPPVLAAPVESDQTVDETVWAGPPDVPRDLPGEIVLEPDERDGWLGPEPMADGADGAASDFAAAWIAVRDANIRPYVDWVTPAPLSLPVATVKAAPPAPPPRHDGNRPNQGGGPGARRDKNRRRRRGGGRPGPDRPRGPTRGPRLPGMYNPGGD
jgi:hypothetical protein